MVRKNRTARFKQVPKSDWIGGAYSMHRDYGKFILGVAILNLFVAIDTTAFWIGFLRKLPSP